MSKVRPMPEGYTYAEISNNLKIFIEHYAKEDEGHPGCPSECIQICQSEGIRELEDLKLLSKRTWLGGYFPAKVALAFESAMDSPIMDIQFGKVRDCCTAGFDVY